MTTDTFTETVRAEAERRAPLDGHTAPALHQECAGLVEMAEWTRDHLATQEPTEAEVRAVKIALIQYEYRVVPGNELTMIRHLGREDEYDKRARAALSAARDARLNGEKR